MMYRSILVGYDGSEGGRDALALAQILRAPEGVVIVACVHPASGPPHDGRLDTLLADAAAQIIGGARTQVHEDWLQIRTTPGHSPAHGLHVLSEEVEADLVIVGSSDRAERDRVHAGSTGERLLNGSACPVAVAPRGFATEALTPRVVGVAYDGSEESCAALSEATTLAVEFEATLRLITAVPPLESRWAAAAFAGTSGDELRQQRHEGFRQELADAAQSLPAETRAATTLVAGRPSEVIADEAEKGIHLLLMGSRSYGPIRRVMVGSTAIAIMRFAPCPVIVIPRGATASHGGEAASIETTTVA
jgi:nucleotide-binding universal stress UspA family protein